MLGASGEPVTAGDLLTLEHRLLVFVPRWKRRRVHRPLLARNLGARMETASSYAQIIRGIHGVR